MADEREDRFVQLYKAACYSITCYAMRRVLSKDDAADVVAETFSIAWRRFEDVPPGDGALPWLYSTAHNVLLNLNRTQRRRGELVERMARELQRVEPSDLPREESGVLALQCLRSLPEPDRELLMLSAWEGLDSADLGRAMGCSAAAARIRLHRARKRLTSEIERFELPLRPLRRSGQLLTERPAPGLRRRPSPRG